MKQSKKSSKIPKMELERSDEEDISTSISDSQEGSSLSPFSSSSSSSSAKSHAPKKEGKSHQDKKPLTKGKPIDPEALALIIKQSLSGAKVDSKICEKNREFIVWKPKDKKKGEEKKEPKEGYGGEDYTACWYKSDGQINKSGDYRTTPIPKKLLKAFFGDRDISSISKNGIKMVKTNGISVPECDARYLEQLSSKKKTPKEKAAPKPKPAKKEPKPPLKPKTKNPNTILVPLHAFRIEEIKPKMPSPSDSVAAILSLSALHKPVTKDNDLIDLYEWLPQMVSKLSISGSQSQTQSQKRKIEEVTIEKETEKREPSPKKINTKGTHSLSELISVQNTKFKWTVNLCPLWYKYHKMRKCILKHYGNSTLSDPYEGASDSKAIVTITRAAITREAITMSFMRHFFVFGAAAPEESWENAPEDVSFNGDKATTTLIFGANNNILKGTPISEIPDPDNSTHHARFTHEDMDWCMLLFNRVFPMKEVKQSSWSHWLPFFIPQ